VKGDGKMIRVHQVICTLEEDPSLLKEKCAQKLHIPLSDIRCLRIYRESIDARKEPLRFSYTVDLEVKNGQKLLHKKDVERTPDATYRMPVCGKEAGKGRVIVAGFGPAGIFAALLLGQMGYRPLVLERGEEMDKRVGKVEAFWKNGILDPDSNVQFGEGGAGTFSDGKLTTRSKDLRSRKVLEEFVRFGAPADILYAAHPHIGTDLLRDIVKRMRKEIVRLGGEIRFASPLLDVDITEETITRVLTKEGWIDCKALLLAVGHSARDTFEMLINRQVYMEQKSFAVGVRVEHPQTLINEAQYKAYARHPRLKAAEYRLTHTSKKQRGVYTFCMCPGGSVVAGASETGGVVVNGMSEHARDKENANSAVLVQVHPCDVGSHLSDGIAFQRNLEQKAFAMGNHAYDAPVQLMKDFMHHRCSTMIGGVKPSIQPGYTLCDLHDILPEFVSEALEEAFVVFDQKLHGFLLDDAVLTGVETRSSSPLRIVRDRESLSSLTVCNLYPCGEGAGYAGGIVSAAIDGLRCAEQIIQRFFPS